MVPVMSLWLPIIVSAVIVFLASSIIHMVLTYHRTDFRRVPKEDEVMASLRAFNLPPGDYAMPNAATPAAMKDPGFISKMKSGPVVFMTVVPPGPPTMGMSLLLWFLYCVVVSLFCAYITGRALGPGADYLMVFRFVGTSAFMGYGLALLHDSIWYRRRWATTFKSVADGFVYGLLTAGTFGWLWP